MSLMTPRTIGKAGRALGQCQASSSKQALTFRSTGARTDRAASSSRPSAWSMASSSAAPAPSTAGIEGSSSNSPPRQDLPFPNHEFPLPRSRRNTPAPHSTQHAHNQDVPQSSLSAAPPRRLADILRSSLDTIPQTPQRAFKGVHSRRDRAKGTTPQEAKALNQVIAGLYKDLERFGSPLQSTSNPITDPFGQNFANAPRRERSVAQLRSLLRRADDGMSESEAAEMWAEIDELKEDMSSVVSESDLIQWAERRVFSPQVTSTTSSGEDGPSYSRAYPYILAHLISTTRDTFRDPSLALAFFQHAQTLSLESYISGCLTPAYNELLKTRWKSFNDLEGVSQGVKEMETNGVAWDGATQKLIGSICENLSASGIMNGGESLWKEYVMARWRVLEGKVQMGAGREEGWDRLAEAKRMARGFDRDTRMAQARFGGTEGRPQGHMPRYQPPRFQRSHRRREDHDDSRWSRGWDEEMDAEPQRAFA